MRRMYSGPELLELDCMLPKYVNSSTESRVLPTGEVWLEVVESTVSSLSKASAEIKLGTFYTQHLTRSNNFDDFTENQ